MTGSSNSLYTIKNSVLEQEHLYGSTIHLLGNAYTNTLLAQFGSPALKGVLLFHYLKQCYQYLMSAVLMNHYPSKHQQCVSRMIEHTPKAQFESVVIDPMVKSVVVDIARAGIYPAQVCYELLNLCCHPLR